jgi:hypothetical protein
VTQRDHSHPEAGLANFKIPKQCFVVAELPRKLRRQAKPRSAAAYCTPEDVVRVGTGFAPDALPV